MPAVLRRSCPPSPSSIGDDRFHEKDHSCQKQYQPPERSSRRVTLQCIMCAAFTSYLSSSYGGQEFLLFYSRQVRFERITVHRHPVGVFVAPNLVISCAFQL